MAVAECFTSVFIKGKKTSHLAASSRWCRGRVLLKQVQTAADAQ